MVAFLFIMHKCFVAGLIATNHLDYLELERLLESDEDRCCPADEDLIYLGLEESCRCARKTDSSAACWVQVPR